MLGYMCILCCVFCGGNSKSVVMELRIAFKDKRLNYKSILLYELSYKIKVDSCLSFIVDIWFIINICYFCVNYHSIYM